MRSLPLALILTAAPLVSADPPARVSQPGDGQQVAITVYNSGRALVTDRRGVALAAGDGALQFEGVAREIMPATVAIRSTNDPDGLMVLEQNYEYDLLSPRKLLDKYVGRELTLVWREKDGAERRENATLLANNEAPVWRIGNRIVTGELPARMEFSSLPETLIARPSLVWRLRSKAARSHDLEVRYLTGGISWSADYVLTLAADGARADLDGWVTINNNSGAEYREAKLQLIAGDVHQAPAEGMAMGRMAPASMVAEDNFREKSFFEYHLYTLERPATLRDNSQKQISLLDAAGVPVERIYRLAGQSWYYRQQYAGESQKIAVVLRLRNRREDKLGMPLPKGIVRVYQRDTDGSSQFVGEDAIDHTPKDEAVELTVGNAFDIAAERKQSDFKVINSCANESAFEIRLRNHKAEPVVVVVSEPVGGDWTMVENSHPFTKTAAFSAEFKVPVAKDGETVLRYRIRSRWCK